MPNTRKKYLGSGVLIKKAIKKYGKHSFKLEVICYLSTEEELNIFEKHLIAKYREILGQDNLYNVTDGGEGGSNNPIHAAKISKALKGRIQPRDLVQRRRASSLALKRKISPEHKIKLIQGIKNKIYTPELRAKLSANRKDRKMSEEAKDRIRLFRIGKKLSIESKDKVRRAKIEYWKARHAKTEYQTMA